MGEPHVCHTAGDQKSRRGRLGKCVGITLRPLSLLWSAGSRREGSADVSGSCGISRESFSGWCTLGACVVRPTLCTGRQWTCSVRLLAGIAAGQQALSGTWLEGYQVVSRRHAFKAHAIRAVTLLLHGFDTWLPPVLHGNEEHERRRLSLA